jgi:hypothetical protein
MQVEDVLAIPDKFRFGKMIATGGTGQTVVMVVPGITSGGREADTRAP